MYALPGEEEMNRRSFIKRMGLGAVGVALVGLPVAKAAGTPLTMEKVRRAKASFSGGVFSDSAGWEVLEMETITEVRQLQTVEFMRTQDSL